MAPSSPRRTIFVGLLLMNPLIPKVPPDILRVALRSCRLPPIICRISSPSQVFLVENLLIRARPFENLLMLQFSTFSLSQQRSTAPLHRRLRFMNYSVGSTAVLRPGPCPLRLTRLFMPSKRSFPVFWSFKWPICLLLFLDVISILVFSPSDQIQERRGGFAIHFFLKSLFFFSSSPFLRIFDASPPPPSSFLFLEAAEVFLLPHPRHL